MVVFDSRQSHARAYGRLRRSQRRERRAMRRRHLRRGRVCRVGGDALQHTEA